MPESANAAVTTSVAGPVANSPATYGAFVNWLTIRTLTLPLSQGRGDLLSPLPLGEADARERGGGGKKGSLFMNAHQFPRNTSRVFGAATTSLRGPPTITLP